MQSYKVKKESHEKTEQNISFISHNLNNLVGNAVGYLQLIKMDFPCFQGSEYINATMESLYRVSKLSNEISFSCHSKISDKKDASPDLLILNVKEHLFYNVKPAYKRLKIMYPQLIIKDTYKTIGKEKYLFANQNALTQFRENIVSNAINANASTLEVQHEMKEHCITISYTDNGNGMTNEEVEKTMVFQHGDGILHGVGTKSILKIASEHNIYISYSSRVGEGTVIRAIVPYAND